MSCPRKDKCSAPLCPMDEISMQQIWLPDEEICKHRSHLEDRFVKQQRKIQKKARDRDTYYTLEMLSVECIVKAGMTGIDPDRAYNPQVEIWMRKHPPISEARRTASKLVGAKVGTYNLSAHRKLP